MIKVIWPEYIELKLWAAQLIVDYPNDPIPLLTDENKWQEWGAILANTGVFQKASIPTPFSISQGKKNDNFKSWQDWAKIVYNLMANETNERT